MDDWCVQGTTKKRNYRTLRGGGGVQVCESVPS